MKNLMFALIGLMLVTSACVKMDDEIVPEVINTSDYTLKLNGVLTNTKDTMKYELNQIILAELADATGKKVVAEVNFGNGNAAIVADNAADKYSIAGAYKLTATILNTTPAVELTANVLI